LESEEIDTSKLRVLFEQAGTAVAALTVDGDNALDLWERLYGLVPKTRCWPVLLNPEEDDGQLPDSQDARPVADILKEAENIDGRALLDQWHDQNLKNLGEDAYRHSADGYEEDAEHFRELLKGPKEFRGIPRGDWPEDAFPTSPF